ncbi:GNAT family N-acetyltransferase [Candidatus Parcubacteria bacterium]|nr:GNAT family N-acetyltransferase [Candidatus Parcubacteria bacterium]
MVDKHEIVGQHVSTSLVYGKDLNPQDLGTINLNRKIEFNSEPFQPTPDNENWDKPYFMVKDGDELLAFGRLHSVGVELQGMPSEILGVATIISIHKSEGHGRTLMEYMRQHIEETGMTAIGFCGQHNSEFYRKCGFSILPKGTHRFTFLNDKGEIAKPHYPDSDVLYIDGNDHLIETLVANPTESITAYRPAW